MFRRSSILVVAVWACNSSKPPAAPVQIASIEPAEGRDALAVVVQTAPSASIECFAGIKSAWAIADAAGRASLVVDLEGHPDHLPTVRLSCSAKGGGYESRELPRPSYLALERGQLKCRGRHDCDGTVVPGDPLEVTLYRAPAGTLVELGDSRATAATGAPVHVARPLGLAAQLPDLRVADLLGDGPFSIGSASVGLRLGFPDGSSARTTIPIGRDAYVGALASTLGKLARGAVRFPGEPARAGAASLLILGAERRLLGTAERVRDIDRVALIDVESKQVVCGEYAAAGSMTSARLTFHVYSLRAVAYDRRTGSRLGARTFPSKWNGCPESVHDRTDRLTLERSAAADWPSALAWAAQFGP